MTHRRIAQVIIIDPDNRVPIGDCLIYRGEPVLTDSTDQELFYELDIRNMLAEHNELRKKIINKDVKERTEYLEEIKVRDLRMVVVTIASFA